MSGRGQSLSPFSRFQSWPDLLRMATYWPGLLHVGATPGSVAKVAAGQVYLATPYTLQATDPQTGIWSHAKSRRMMALAGEAAADLARRGVTAVSPIVLSAAMCHDDPTLDPVDQRFWARWCAPILAASRAVVVPDITGWDASLGVWREVIWALEHNVPVHVYAVPS